MIQRIQSLYLLFGSIAALSLLFFNNAWSDVTATWPWFVLALQVFCALIGVLGLYAIFSYENRKKQKKIISWGQSGALFLLIFLFGGLAMQKQLLVQSEGVFDWLKLAGLVVPLMCYLVFSMAGRSVQKDIELIKSMDRLR